jgi:hypothetical protein
MVALHSLAPSPFYRWTVLTCSELGQDWYGLPCVYTCTAFFCKDKERRVVLMSAPRFVIFGPTCGPPSARTMGLDCSAASPKPQASPNCCCCSLFVWLRACDLWRLEESERSGSDRLSPLIPDLSPKVQLPRSRFAPALLTYPLVFFSRTQFSIFPASS